MKAGMAVPLLVRRSVEFLAAAAFAVGVYELVVAGALALWPKLTDSWILLLWMTSATIAGLGMNRVRRLVGVALRRVWPATAGPSEALVAMTGVGAVQTGPERVCADVAALLVAGTGARAAQVWLAEPDGRLRCVGNSPNVPTTPTTAALGELPDHVAPVTDADGLLGALVLTSRSRRGVTVRLAEDAADAVAPLLRNLRLTGELAAALAHEQQQERLLARSRHRVIVARDVARARLSDEINGRVAGVLAACADDVDTLLAESAPPVDTILTTMTRRMDVSITDFRQIVHGFYPAVLTDHGLAPSLDNLVSTLPWTASCEADALPRFDERVEMGVYFCLATVVGSLHDMRADDEGPIRQVDLRVALGEASPPILSATVLVRADRSWSFDTDTIDAIDDRVGALDGRLDIAREPGGVRLTLSVPVSLTEPAGTATGRRP
jgi:signal transduction histidine kinase